MTHFMDAAESDQNRTLCGKPWDCIVWANDRRATCVPCQDEWVKRTGWSFPLPETVGIEAENS